jgi:hypothetical protein
MCEIEQAPLLRMGSERPCGRAATEADHLAAIYGDCHRTLHGGDSPRLEIAHPSFGALAGTSRPQYGTVK